MKNGDYVPDGKGSFQVCTGPQELLQRVIFRLTARRGALPFLPNLGSRLYLLTREKPSARGPLAVQYVAQALEEEQDIKITGVELTGGKDGLAQLKVSLTWQGEELALSVPLEG